MKIFTCCKCSTQYTEDRLTDGTLQTGGGIFLCPECGTQQTIDLIETDVTEITSTETRVILTKIYNCCQSQEEMIGAASVAIPEFFLGLLGENWFLARYAVQKCCQEGKITEDLQNRILACIPPAEQDEIAGPGEQ